MSTETRVRKSWSPTATTHALRTERPPGFVFRAGQHILLEIETPDGPDDRFLSIASGPARDHLEFAVRTSDSDFKKAFRRLRPGDTVRVSRPSGRFTLDEDAPAVFLSGGIGVTPIKSMIEHATDSGLDTPLVLLYGNRSPREIVFRDELDRLAGQNPRFHPAYTVDEPPEDPTWGGLTGHIDMRMVHAETADLRGAVYYTCGPPGMVAAMTRLLDDLGARPDHVRTENFSGYGALENPTQENTKETKRMARIVLLKDTKPLEISAEDVKDGAVWVCRCGLSADWPFCDSSHSQARNEKTGTVYAYRREPGSPRLSARTGMPATEEEADPRPEARE